MPSEIMSEGAILRSMLHKMERFRERHLTGYVAFVGISMAPGGRRLVN